MKTYPFSRGVAVGRVGGLVLPVGLVDGRACACARACAASPSKSGVDGALERARECQIAAEVERALRPARDSARGGAACRGDF